MALCERSTGRPARVAGTDRAIRPPSAGQDRAASRVAVLPLGGRRRSCDSPSTGGRVLPLDRTAMAENDNRIFIYVEHSLNNIIPMQQRHCTPMYEVNSTYYYYNDDQKGEG